MQLIQLKKLPRQNLGLVGVSQSNFWTFPEDNFIYHKFSICLFDEVKLAFQGSVTLLDGKVVKLGFLHSRPKIEGFGSGRHSPPSSTRRNLANHHLHQKIPRLLALCKVGWTIDSNCQVGIFKYGLPIIQDVWRRIMHKQPEESLDRSKVSAGPSDGQFLRHVGQYWFPTVCRVHAIDACALVHHILHQHCKNRLRQT